MLNILVTCEFQSNGSSGPAIALRRYGDGWCGRSSFAAFTQALWCRRLSILNFKPA